MIAIVEVTHKTPGSSIKNDRATAWEECRLQRSGGRSKTLTTLVLKRITNGEAYGSIPSPATTLSSAYDNPLRVVQTTSVRSAQTNLRLPKSIVRH